MRFKNKVNIEYFETTTLLSVQLAEATMKVPPCQYRGLSNNITRVMTQIRIALN